MSNKSVLAVGAHPDDVEFMMAGTLILLKEQGYEPHILTVANGSCGTAEYSREDIIGIRGEEAKAAAGVIGAIYHPGLVDDIQIYYVPELVARVGAIVREINPEIILAPSPQDYMEDHQNSCRLIVTAAFCKGMRNFETDPAHPAVTGDTFLYHALPYGLHDGMRQAIVPNLYVNLSDVVDTKQEMLACHKSQQAWLDTSQGLNQYLQTMRDMSAEVGRMSGRGWAYAEGWRQHSHLGFSEADGDRLKEVLGDKVALA
ncbi:MAG: LmbE family protein [Planctomycetes bacterium]|nr:LmbE family protein [Planctomycetota bacterium]